MVSIYIMSIKEWQLITFGDTVELTVDTSTLRALIENNHTATHLYLDPALKKNLRCTCWSGWVILR